MACSASGTNAATTRTLGAITTTRRIVHATDTAHGTAPMFALVKPLSNEEIRGFQILVKQRWISRVQIPYRLSTLHIRGAWR